jgi:hypothetical protein
MQPGIAARRRDDQKVGRYEQFAMAETQHSDRGLQMPFKDSGPRYLDCDL